jgi:hypothetical protein
MLIVLDSESNNFCISPDGQKIIVCDGQIIKIFNNQTGEQ